MSKILASRDQDLQNNRKSMIRLVIIGGTIALTIAAAIVILTFFS